VAFPLRVCGVAPTRVFWGMPKRATWKLLAVLCLGLIGRLDGAEPVVPYGDNAAVGRYYDIRGFRMYTETYGSGRPLLLIHGNNGNMAAFAPIVPLLLAAHYRVILADSRSQGKSRDPGHPLTFEMMADDFDALLEAMHVPAAYVVGWSDGGINALLLAMRHPDRVLALASTGANLWPAADAFAGDGWEWILKTYKEGVGKPRLTDKERNDWKLFMLDYAEPHITTAELKKVRCPALIVCGDHDFISIEHTVLIYRSIPKAQLWVVPNSGHPTLVEHPVEFVRVVDAFFGGPSPARKD
jgi:pimeloyl-ACP methyl ester carboxylesterase